MPIFGRARAKKLMATQFLREEMALGSSLDADTLCIKVSFPTHPPLSTRLHLFPQQHDLYISGTPNTSLDGDILTLLLALQLLTSSPSAGMATRSADVSPVRISSYRFSESSYALFVLGFVQCESISLSTESLMNMLPQALRIGLDSVLQLLFCE